MRILHAAGYELAKDGKTFHNVDWKMHHGLTRAGHYVFPFSFGDVARAEGWFGRKRFGFKKMNSRLLDACANLRPDVLLIGQGDPIEDETLAQVRREFPQMKLAMWWVDPLFYERGQDLLRRRAALCDVIFATTGGAPLAALATPTCMAAHVPNPVDLAVEASCAFERPAWDCDLLFAGSDNNEPERQAALRQVRDGIPGLRFRLHQALGTPRIFGADYYAALATSRMGLNLSRRTDVPWYSSDRVAQMLGMGLLTFCPRTPGLAQLYGADSMVWFDSLADMQEQIRHWLPRAEEGRALARQGWEAVHRATNGTRVARFMVETILRQPLSEPYEWAGEMYGGEKRK